MATLQMTEASFEATVKQGGIVLLDFWAAWCGPSRVFAPVFEAAAELIGKVRALDRDGVHREIEAARPARPEEPRIAKEGGV
jgi:thiol-disulfide isomerase/thioredoxin